MAYQETVPTVTNSTVKQAFINSDSGDQLGFFSLNNHINESQFQRVLVALNDSEKQQKLKITEGKNKNGKAFAIVRTPKDVVLGILSGYTASTLIAIEYGTAVFSDATPIDDVTEVLDF